jgi:glutaminyl-peptide cyclotransferase
MGARYCAAALTALAILNVCPAAAEKYFVTSQELSSWSGDRAMADIAKQLSFGPRAIGTVGHQAAVDWIEGELTSALATVVVQDGLASGPGYASRRITNIIGRFDATNPNRIIIGTHYDSIIRAYADAKNPNGPMPGANNSASGVAVLLETIRTLKSLGRSLPFGIDFVFFDGEEGPLALGAGDPDWAPLGSPYFTAHLQEIYPDKKPVEGIVFDMVCYKGLVLKPETSSLQSADNEVVKFWTIGHQIAPSVFAPAITPGPIFDDQTALNQAGIPAFLVIGFEYDPWFNTTNDTIDKCSTASLEAVGRTLVRYLFLGANGSSASQ